MMDDDENDENLSLLDKTSDNDSTKVILSLEHLEVEIDNYLKEKLGLREVIDELEKKFSHKLSDIDCCHVEDKYTELLTSLWLDEGLQHLSNVLDPTNTLQLIEVLHTVDSFSGFCSLFGPSGPYNVLILDLFAISTSCKSQEQECICELKKRCYNDIFNRTTNIKNEMDFVKHFLEALKSFKNTQLFCQSFNIEGFLRDCDKVNFELILSNVLTNKLSGPKLRRLKKSAKTVFGNEEYFFIEDLRAMINDYLKPVVIKESNADGRQLLEVSGKHIVISNELDGIEKNPSFSHVVEVRFVGAGVIHIDADLSSSTWHGKNIVISGETLIVSEDKCVVWDVSGIDAEFTASSEVAGTSEDGCGLKGKDGNPGESGGNVCILVETIENFMNFKIVSNGGNGSKGQNGGPGTNGQDGECIDPRKFKEYFPPVSHLRDKQKNYTKTMESVCKSLLSVEKLHYCNVELNLKNKTEFVRLVQSTKIDLKNIYFETTTEEGCKIKFSFHNEGFFSCCQSFLLYKGALGKVGKVGGNGGYGGKGGFAGHIKVHGVEDINKFSYQIAENGADGEAGKSGRTGNPGKSGLDRGYMDCTLATWHNIISSVKWPKMFIPGPGDINRLTVLYYNEKKNDRVKCPHNGLYAEITPIRRTDQIDQIFQRMGLDTVIQTHEHEAINAKRKKTICQESIEEQYKEKDSLWNVNNIENALEKVQEEIEELINKASKETEKITQEAKITRQISYYQNDWYLEEIKYDVKLENKDCDKEVEVIVSSTTPTESVKPVKLSLFNFVPKARTIVSSLAQLMSPGMSPGVELVAAPGSTLINEPNANASETESVSLDKHHLDTLKDMYVSISLDDILERNCNTKSHSTNTIFLNEIDSVVSDVNKVPSHPIIEKLFCEDSMLLRQEVVTICSGYSLNEEPLKEALKCFIYEFEEESSDSDSAVGELVKLENNFNLLKELRLKQTLFPFKKELLSKEKNKHLYQYLLNGVLKQSVESKLKFEDEIAKDKFLSYLYNSFMYELKKSCDWETNGNFGTCMHVFQKYMMDKGPFAICFREFLAQHYDVNLLFYTLNGKNNRLELVSNHNPKAKSEIFFLLKRNKFVKLNFDYEFSRLFEKYKHVGNLLNNIMFNFCSFTDKLQISDYVSSSPFTSDDYVGLASSTVVGMKINHIIRQESYVKTIANSYFPQKDAIWVKCMLEKLKAEFIGYENILHYMALHFEVEGNQIMANELCFVINQILKFSIEESKVMSLVSWIIAAQPQQLWVLELALLKLELYLQRPLKHEVKCKWREYLQDQTEKERLMVFMKKLECESSQISVESMGQLLCLLSNVPKAHVGLEDVNLSEWKYYLKDRFWAHHMTRVTNWSEGQLKTLSYYLVMCENSVGKELCLQFVDILKEHGNEIKTEADKDVLLKILKSLNSKEVCLSAELRGRLSKSLVKGWLKVIDDESINTVSERTLKRLVQLIQNSGNTSESILNILPSVESDIKLTNSLSTSLKQSLKENNLKRLFSDISNPNKSKSSVLLKIKSFIKEMTPNEETFNKILTVLSGITQGLSFENLTKSLPSNLKESKSRDQYIDDLCTQNIFLPFVELCIGLKSGKWLRNTQKLTVMTLLKNAKNTLAQVSTGEGKSLIVVTVAIIKALLKEKVNIVTSSKVLAKRDAEEYKDIYELCGMVVGHNCSESIEERKKVYSNCQVIYGDLANFQRDYLLDRVYNKNILGDCNFETVIVDEVDSMLLDKGNNVLYLSHDIPGLDKLEPIFIYIWKWISRPVSSEQCEDLFSVQAIKEKVMYELFGVIKKEHIKALDTSMTERQVDRTWECLIETKVINHNGQILKESVNSCNIDSFPEGCILKVHLKYILEKVINREKVLSIPKYLHSFVEDHLEGWIKSGVSAMVMESGRDYIVDIDRSDTTSDINPIITILDRDTGNDLVNSQWDEALHQFLQLKHGCKLSLLNLKAVFISNVSYLKRYKTLYGLTGTLGSLCERELLKEVYCVDFVTIPTAKTKRFSEEPSILCSTTEEWKQSIYEEVYKTTRTNRSALIICETIKDVFILKEKLRPHFRPELIQVYTRDYESLSVADGLNPGNIIISTNLAGRGTDIKLSKELIANGGLYVCLTFLPSNYRVEEQAYGRAARNGEPGTAQLIFRISRQTVSRTATQVIDVKKQRDVYELKRITDIKSYNENQIQHEEKWFVKFKGVFENLRKMKQKEDVKLILLQTFLNQWAYWLDKNKKLLILTSNSKDIDCSLEHFISDWSKLGSGDIEDWSKLITDPTQLVKLGLAYLKQGEKQSSLLLLDKVIKEEPNFSEIAHYYRVYVYTQQQDLAKTDILEPLKFAAKKIKERAEVTEISAVEINWLKEQDNVNLIQVDSFLNQQATISNTYSVFLQSIYRILGSKIFPEIFIIPGQIEKHIAKDIYNSIINEGLLTTPKIKSKITIEDLQFVKKYGLSPNKMKLFINQFEGKDYQEQEFFYFFENKVPIPSRETFWKELVNNEALVNEECYVFIDMQELNLFHPSLCQRIKPKTVEECSKSKMKIWLYQPEELVQIKDSKSLSFIKQDDLVQLIGSNMYQLLEKKDMFTINKLATFDPPKILIFNNFDAISEADFQTINICKETASNIIEDLINQHIINESLYPGLYYLLIDAENIENIELTINKAYTYEVRSLMSVCFAFRIAFEKLKLLITMETCANICLPLLVNLHKRIVLELKENEIIEEAYVNTKGDVSKTLDKLYPKLMSKDGYKKLLNEVCCGVDCVSVVEALIKTNWLIKNTLCLKSDNLYINPRIKSLIYPKPNDTEDKGDKKHKPQKLCLPLHFEAETISVTILNHLFLIENLDHVKSVLNNSKGQYLFFETPSFSLTPLLDVLLEKKLSSEIEIFSLNGFDQLLVLGEKKWTWNTTFKIAGILTISVLQIAVGAVSEFFFPGNFLGLKAIAEGTSDLIFALSCCYSGYCSLKTYMLNKVVSMAITFSQVCTLFKSGFGKGVSGISFKSIKQGFVKALGRFSESSAISTVAKNCSVKVLNAISQGVIYSTVDYVIESHLDKISMAITEAVHHNVDETVDTHSITSSIREICSKYGPADSKTTISVCFSKHIDNSKHEFYKSLLHSVTSIYNLIRKTWNHKKKTSLTTKTDFMYYLEIAKLCLNVVKAIEECKNLFKSLRQQISDVLDTIEEDLQTAILHAEKTRHKSQVSTSEEELNSFTLSMCDDLKLEIKNQLSNCLNKDLLSPVLQFVTDYIVSSSSKFISNKSKTLLRTDDVRKQNVSNYKHTQTKKKAKSNSQTSHESEYEERLLGLLKKQRNMAIFTEIVRKNIPVDTNFLEMCCFVLPKALKNEGVILPNLEIIVERNGTYQRFSTTDAKCEKTTIIISPDSDIVTNIFKNKTLIKCGVDLIITKIVQDNPILSAFPIEDLRSLVAKKIEDAFGTQPLFPTTDLDYGLPCANKYFQMNTSVERKCPYQHFHVDGNYLFNVKVDIDIRNEEKLISLNLVEGHIFKGFTCALNKINNHIHKVQDHLRHFRLSLEDFEEMSHEIVPQTNPAVKGNFHCFAAHYKLVMPFVVEFNENRLEDFTITMRLNNQVRDKHPYSPCGPHITYEVSPNVHFKYLNKGVKGHILINEECTEYSFSEKNFHTAGELILPTGFRLHKTCRVLMLGDSMFEAVSEVASYPNFVALSFTNLDDLKTGIANVSKYYTGIQCVVLVPGGSTSMSRLSGGEITTNIADAVKCIQAEFKETKIYVCSLYKAKSLKVVGKLTQTNKCLKIHCSRMDINYLDTNSFIFADELEDNAIHLNKRGLTKIVQNVL